ncbi:hypothetical protein NQ317_005833 [Molorchus minor]|uniref:Uncharacterized protein n=1 Tax=Molorchus minor TaxID=1323400 RepID=A0ABQ9JYW4_9CUCU|nr:hypothetical protein NQ317_005833 [Molorchus minor]
MNETKIVDMSKEDCKTQYPKMYPVKDFCQITAKPPAECIKYNLVNILAAYVFTTRYFNGEHFHFAKEAVSCIATLSSNLKNIHNFDDFETAVKHAEQQCFNSTWILTDAENIQTMRDDLHKILQGPNDLENKLYIMYALSDMHHLFEESLKPINDTATSTFEAKFSNNHFPAVELEPSDKIKKYIKKIEYYLSYTKDCYNS